LNDFRDVLSLVETSNHQNSACIHHCVTCCSVELPVKIHQWKKLECNNKLFNIKKNYREQILIKFQVANNLVIPIIKPQYLKNQ
jgi:hypothetical protein